MKKKLKLQKSIPFLLSAFWVVLALWVQLAPKTPGTSSELIHNYFKRVDYLAYDIKMLTRVRISHFKPHSIAIVAIDDNSIQHEGRWPWSYYKIAKLIAKLREQGVSVIASDIVFSEEEKNMVTIVANKLMKTNAGNSVVLNELDQLKPEFDNNARLIQQVQNNHDIVLPFLLYATDFTQGVLPKPVAVLDRDEVDTTSILSMPGYITNFAALQAASEHNGFISTLADEDGVIRRTPLVLRYQDKVYSSLALAVAQVLLPNDRVTLNTVDVSGIKYLESVQLGKRRIPTDKAGRVLIPFHGKAHSFKYYSATDVLKNKLKPDELKHRVVFLGSTASAYASFSNTPMDTAMPNVEVHANVLSGILDNEFPYLAYWAKAATIAVILVMGITLTILLPLLSPTLSILLAACMLVLLLAINIWLWVAMNIVFSFSAPTIMTIMIVLTNMTYGFLFESRKKKMLREAFSQYVAPAYVKILLDNPDEYSLEGESAELTVLFADIRNFTSISESLDAAGVKKLLNQYFTPMTEIIFKHGGTIDKYVGDMIMAFWGAPIKSVWHREAAIDSALDMLAKSEELKAGFLAVGLPDVNIGIGINTGMMNVGDMGSIFRRSYTVLGDPVNLGSRLESSTKFYGVKLLVGSDTRVGQTKFVFRWVDKVKVKGKHTAVDVYEVICRVNDATPALLEEVAAHEEAISAYFAADWVSSHKLFAALAKHHTDTLIYQLFLERIAYFKKNPPGSDWDGAYQRMDK